MGRLALISVTDKTGIVDFARQLTEEFDFEIISSGGTAKTLQSAGIPVVKVGEYTGSPEILGGRVKTLHPRIHGGILARRDWESDLAEMEANQIRPFDLVVVNLYPFEQTIANPEVTTAQAIEQIDIGGPAMLRASAKNFAHLTVISNPKYYEQYLSQLRQNNGEISLEFRQKMAGETFALTNAYDGAIAAYFASLNGETTRFHLAGNALQTLRYGENPHQSATWYGSGTMAHGWVKATLLQGKELSYNNLVDLEAARRLIAEFGGEEPAAAILKHNNPCGVAIGGSLVEAYTKAFHADSTSAFGGIVALNQAIDEATAKELTKTFLECVVAPDCSPEARDILAKKSKVRILLLPDLSTGEKQTVKVIAGGFLVQAADDVVETPEEWRVVTEKQPTAAQLAELLFAWKVSKHVKSNAIVVTKNQTTLGVGAGQMNRVGSAKIALEQAGEAAKGGYLASDGFFPFDDSIRTAAKFGIEAIVQPGGSLKDQDSINAANELGLIMVLTGIRHFLH
ncbi:MULTISPECIES: bifunctional phosphoribosylaminoimidazolecarboxamide formyltransferase/IMP cyclohydrolase [unclassified Microcystis]|jgi:phosphoribosylaminoimidazolecarboxamide formyltransferase/IMP cyclohydrolase|uniref:Bifunctional purine biosynthesis protein PurH n=1 Tax=Microcystis flos-aquae Mf_QC_C_20070823_S10D TaxID=2486236 RepID=A0A552L3F9_9CHRO|nr:MULTISPECIES: bifunctional phosphoribosylaminoimidazolecarboxamide formyltransferase/IMP cyclohydrolase [unclassified Microcystis]MCA2817593.1 bifunctional phosphoribosylaminoimidazolecarboxamide formyltransferase/IMP cyclohydrolase [Microcystis sp. M085S1]MCA2856450.1 bifunctional phosphoribosylaminoimidazolecarboxamide formyltransferase/IMP cyclohydrolase [Microcystis sp. M065S1]TRU02098.1 MAG: bifunctional phosphoribosylaminoimidazolecarboxamide formyltransferase/IMP cyclohydrolase [Microc